MVVSNAGPGLLNGSASLLGPDSFSILSGTPFTLASESTTNLIIQFTSLVTGIFSNRVVFTTSGGVSTNSVVGRAIAAPMIQSPAMDQDDFSFSFETVTGFTYTIQFKETLQDAEWQTVESQTGDGLVHRLQVPISGLSQRFYRLLVQ